MKIEKFEDIIAWQKARELTNEIYSSLKSCRDFSYRDQIQRASVSIMNNIAEGFDRKGDKEFRRYLSIAKGSCAEVRSLLYLGQDLGYFLEENAEDLRALSIRIISLLMGFIKSLNKTTQDVGPRT